MTIKKWRPLWSYDVEKTEHWLSEMAVEGKQVTGLNRWTRVFSFDESVCLEADYQLVYDKNQRAMPRILAESGWETGWTEGNWQLLKNGTDAIRTYPSREGILKRNRLHSTVLMGISILYAFQLMPFLVFALMLLFLGPSEMNVVSSPYWSITIFYFLQVIAVIVLAIHATRKLYAFERKFFSTEVDELEPVGKTFTKWRFGWMYAPDLTEKWLSDMAAEGNHLVRIGKPNMWFVFEKDEPKRVSYVFDYQLKPSPSYFDIHKGAGWQLKYTSPYSFTKYSVWLRTYDEGEEMPLFTYDVAEKKAQVRKVVMSALGLFLYMVAISSFALYINYTVYLEEGWTLSRRIIAGLFIVSFISPVIIMGRVLKYSMRMRKNPFVPGD